MAVNSQLRSFVCLLYTSDAADERSSVDLGGRRIIKKKTRVITAACSTGVSTQQQTLNVGRKLTNMNTQNTR